MHIFLVIHWGMHLNFAMTCLSMEYSSSGLTGHCECMDISCTMMKCTPLCMQLGILGKAVFFDNIVHTKQSSSSVIHS